MFAVFASEQLAGLGIVRDAFGLRVEAKVAAGARHDIAEVAECGGDVADLDIRIWLRATADAVDKVLIVRRLVVG